MDRKRRLHTVLIFAICLLGAALIVSPAADARKAKASGCPVATHAKKAAHGTGKKKRKSKHRRKSACLPAATPPAPVSTAPTSPGDGGTSPPPPPPPPPDPCGPTIEKSIGVNWQCSFADDFSGTSLDTSKWVAQRTENSGFTDGESCFVDDSDNVSVSDGTLKLTSREEASSFNCGDPYGDFTAKYTSGMVSTWGRFSQTYGRFEVRAKISPAQVKGLQTSLWLWPADAGHYGDWPMSGEIDIAEMFSTYPDRAVPYIHYNAAVPDPNVTNTDCMITDLSAFHTYAVEWEPGTIKVIYDGNTCLIDEYNPASPLTGAAPFDQPFILALTQGLGMGGNAFDPAATPLPATTTVDYVRIWK